MYRTPLIGLFSLLLLCSLSSCLVTKKKFDEQAALADKYRKAEKDCDEKLDKATAEIAKLNEQLKKLGDQLADLQSKHLTLTEKSDRLAKANEESTELYDKIKKQYDELNTLSSKDKEKLKLALADKEQDLNAKAAELKKLSDALNEREKRVKELESLIARKDEAVAALKKKISDALTGFTSEELKVSQKDGKVYVSLSDKLLFKSGSFAVDEKGKSAIVKVCEVLNKQPEIGMEIEGHTDNKQYQNPKGDIRNNWDLSVMRAAAVANIMVIDGKVEPKRVVPTGRSEYTPVEANDTPEGRAHNRRIELVLSPDLREIFKILDSAQP